MKNLDKILLAAGIVLCAIAVAVCVWIAPSAASSAPAKKALRGTDVPAWSDTAPSAAEAPAPEWRAPEFDLAEGWNYDLFSSPEIRWDTKQKKYFAKELPPPPEEIFGLELKSLSHPRYRFVISSYTAGTRPVPEKISEGRYGAVLTLADISKKKNAPLIISFGNSAASVVLTDEKNEAGARVVTFNLATPVTLPKANAKLKTFRIVQSKAASGAFSEKLEAVIIDEAGRAPREFVVSTTPVADDARTEAVFTDGSGEWLYSETRVPGRKTPVRELAFRASENEPFASVGSETDIRIDGNVFRIKGLDISAQEARIEKQSSEIDKKTKAPKKTERVLSVKR